MPVQYIEVGLVSKFYWERDPPGPTVGIWEKIIIIGVLLETPLNVPLETPKILLETLGFHCRPPDFHLKPQIFLSF